MKILIIPDIHGRTFWKKAVEEHAEECDKIIFLGDYLDPYPWECIEDGITRKSSIENFKEIMQYKKDNPDKVVLLLGNHDLPYYDRLFITRSRYDSSNAYKIKQNFGRNRNLFQLAYELDMDKHYLFTHAGVSKSWYEWRKNIIGDFTVENLNRLKGIPAGIKILCDVSRERGGFGSIGSMVWSDILEKGDTEDFEGIYQIFGHSQQISQPVITKTWACLDCRKAFILNDDGTFTQC